MRRGFSGPSPLFPTVACSLRLDACRLERSSAVPFRPKTRLQTPNSPSVILRLSSAYPPVSPLLPPRSAISARTALYSYGFSTWSGDAPSPIVGSRKQGVETHRRFLTHPFLVSYSSPKPEWGAPTEHTQNIEAAFSVYSVCSVGPRVGSKLHAARHHGQTEPIQSKCVSPLKRISLKGGAN